MLREKSLRPKGGTAGLDIRSRIRHENTNLGGGVDISSSGSHGDLASAASGASRIVAGYPSAGSSGGGGSSGYAATASAAINGRGEYQQHGQQSSIASLGSSTATSHSQGSSSGSHRGQPPVSTPSRPARSNRRPLSTMSSQQDLYGQGTGTGHRADLPTLQIPDDRPAGRPGRNLLADQDHLGQGQLFSPAEEDEDAYGGLSPLRDQNGRSPLSTTMSVSPSTPASVGSLTHRNEPAALGNVMSALSAAGRKHQANRIQRGTTTVVDEDEKRRRGSQMKLDELRRVERRPLEAYLHKEDSRAFREINAVLRKAKAEWAPMSQDDFNAASLALSMMDDGSLAINYQDFEVMKKMLERALQGTLDDHYEAFASAITLHNNVLSSLTKAQGGVTAARKRLRDSRDTLGAKRADLVQMWQKSQGIKESLRLLDTVENLKNIPDRLENLLAEKRFLEAVNVLTRGLRTIDKAEIVDVGGTSDLRAYLKNQEHAVLEVLIEELQNHLFLKSPACGVRWQAYTPNQKTMPASELDEKAAEAEQEALANGHGGEADLKASVLSLPGEGSAAQGGALGRFLVNLSSRPSFDPNLATDIAETNISTSASTSALTGELVDKEGLPNSKSTETNIAGMLSGANEGGIGSEDLERNSFLYIEMLLESVARLGKLPHVLDSVAHHMQVEVHQLVDTTIDEVERRNEPSARQAGMRPGSVIATRTSSRLLSFGTSTNSWRESASPGQLHASAYGLSPLQMLRRTNAESNASVMDAETLQDLFWTLFSKFDAVLQGHRALYEVASRISSRSGYSSSTPLGRTTTMSSPVKVWRQIQGELRSLLHDHLVDESQPSAGARRNVTISVNDVLRFGKTDRDKSKVSSPLSC